ncbi:iron transporter [Vandammella animalimorsus]|uniref:iron transporter n=1 Tax=Vandammella animalimorsus TaxID=2029117 RepID=UPI001EED7EBD|nr:iron transporter [Vandammella animalimorsus]
MPQPSQLTPAAARPAPGGSPRRYRLAVLSRTVAAVGLGYALSACAASLLALLLHWAGMPRVDAVLLSNMLAFVLYATALLWSFACASAWRTWCGLGAPALASALALWAVQGLRGGA